VVDWILQAKLCVRAGDAITALRQHGIRGVHEVAKLTDDEITALANETAATLFSLKRIRCVARNDTEIERLQRIATQLSRYTKSDDRGEAGGRGDAD